MTFSALGLAVAGQGLDEGDNLHAAHDRVVLHGKGLLDRDFAGFQVFAHLGALDAGGLRLFERRLALFLGELRNRP
jgi:hypothetical protein